MNRRGLLSRLPWRRRAASAEASLHQMRQRLARVHQDWTQLAQDLGRIDREIQVNDWTLTAKRVFAGRDE